MGLPEMVINAMKEKLGHVSLDFDAEMRRITQQPTVVILTVCSMGIWLLLTKNDSTED
jgi:hypothetical protein